MLCGFVPLPPQTMRIQDYQYNLPDDRIARYPLPERDASKLLVYREGQLEEDIYGNLDRHLEPGALLVFNNTRVIPARLRLQKPSGGQVELFCLEPQGELNTGMQQKGESIWKCLVGGAKKWKSGPVLLETDSLRLQAEKMEAIQDAYWVRLKWEPAHWTFSEVLAEAGQAPLPPYLQRAAEAADRERYQTIYAQLDGSVAAPTAGLHFTERLFQRLAQKNIGAEYLTLHVGAGTFKPVKTETVAEHVMHAECFEVSANLLRRLRDHNQQLVAVGTTTLRTLESLVLMGRKLLANPDLPPEALDIGQWDAFQTPFPQVGLPEAFDALLRWMDRRQIDRIEARTQLLLAPGYRVCSVDALATNFHQPGSTLLLLVAALVGDDWKKIYDYALNHDFRFLSYGDGCLIHLKKSNTK